MDEKPRLLLMLAGHAIVGRMPEEYVKALITSFREAYGEGLMIGMISTNPTEYENEMMLYPEIEFTLDSINKKVLPPGKAKEFVEKGRNSAVIILDNQDPMSFGLSANVISKVLGKKSLNAKNSVIFVRGTVVTIESILADAKKKIDMQCEIAAVPVR